MSATAVPPLARAATERSRPVDRRYILLWEGGAFLFILVASSGLHFFHAFTGFQPWAAAFGSVNESTFEHLKLFFWPALAYALLQLAFMRNRANNFWWAKGLGIITAPLVLMLAFYFYLGIAMPIYGRGVFWADIGTGILGVLAGTIVSYRVMAAPEMGRAYARVGVALCIAMGMMYVVFTYYPPRAFLFENFAGYRYSGEYGILAANPAAPRDEAA